MLHPEIKATIPTFVLFHCGDVQLDSIVKPALIGRSFAWMLEIFCWKTLSKSGEHKWRRRSNFGFPSEQESHLQLLVFILPL